MAQITKMAAKYLPQALVMVALLGVTGCYVEAEAPPPPPRCADAVWIRGHHDRYGDWHPGHYRCGPRRAVVVVGGG